MANLSDLEVFFHQMAVDLENCLTITATTTGSNCTLVISIKK